MIGKVCSRRLGYQLEIFAKKSIKWWRRNEKEEFLANLILYFAVALLNVGFLYQYRYIIDAIAAGDRQAFVSYFVQMGLTVLVMLVLNTFVRLPMSAISIK